MLFVTGTILSLMLVKNVVTFCNQVFAEFVYGKVTHDIRSVLAQRLHTAPYRFFLKTDPGRMINALTNETWKIPEVMQASYILITSVSATTIFLAFLCILSWQVTLFVGCGLLLIQCIQSMMVRRLRALSADSASLSQVLAGRMLDAVYATRLVQIFGREERENNRFDRSSDAVRRAYSTLSRHQWRVHPTSEVLITAVFFLVLAGAHWAGVALPLLAAFVVLLYRAQPHIRSIHVSLARLRAWSGSIQEVEWLLAAAEAPRSPSSGLTFAGLSDGIAFEAVSFRYADATRARPALDQASFVIRKGRSTAIIGRSGSGKTTIVNLLCRLLEPTEGAIVVDGTPLSAIDVRAWRRQLGVAGQDSASFRARFSKTSSTASMRRPGEAEHAARLADAHEFITHLPAGYDTVAGSSGVQLSTGQTQRIGLARALARNPDILILDEATNAVDGLSEASIVETLRHRRGELTTIVISHRRSTIAFCDDAILVEAGRVSRFGPLGRLRSCKTVTCSFSERLPPTSD